MHYFSEVVIYNSLSLSINFDFNSICERVTPRLSHANAAVVLSAVKVGIVNIQVLLTCLSKFHSIDWENLIMYQDNPPCIPAFVLLLTSEVKNSVIRINRNLCLYIYRVALKVTV